MQNRARQGYILYNLQFLKFFFVSVNAWKGLLTEKENEQLFSMNTETFLWNPLLVIIVYR